MKDSHIIPGDVNHVVTPYPRFREGWERKKEESLYWFWNNLFEIFHSNAEFSTFSGGNTLEPWFGVEEENDEEVCSLKMC